MAVLKNLAVDCYSSFFSPCPSQQMTHLNTKNSSAESISDVFEFSAQLNEIKREGLFRFRRVVETPQSIFLQINGQKVLNFCSNDYLGLANHPEIIKAFKQAVEDYGVGSGSAHLVCGHSKAHQQLEEELADFTGRDKALLFSTGYMANLGVISALIGQGDAVFEDRLNHASLLDGGLISGARFHRYLHTDLSSLQTHLKRNNSDKRLIVTDGVFSMDGDFAPLKELVEIAKQYNAGLMLDDAHGISVLGEKGGGLIEYLGMNQNDVPVLVGTLGKGFGTFGAFVAGSEQLIEILIQKARTYIYTTALPPAIAEATRASLKRVINDTWRRDKLKQLSERFRKGAQQLNLNLIESQSVIHALIIGDSRRTIEMSAALLNKGILISAIRPPTVPLGSARLRITLSALHEDHHIDRLLETLGQVAG
jgi:8-amino-7-oxononanoate synthase